MRTPSRRRALRATALMALALLACTKDTSPAGPTPAAANTVAFGGSSVTVAIAATVASREHGLMGMTRMAADSGMLFVFADDRQRAFWMKDTPMPLSIAFLDAGKKVIFLADMPANSTTLYGGLNAGTMRYALEVNQGWFASHGVTVGTNATFTLPAGLVIALDP